MSAPHAKKNVGGNERADSAAKDAAKNGGRKIYGWSSLTHVKPELNHIAPGSNPRKRS